MDYEEMLGRVYSGLPKQTLSRERFVMPEADSFVQGSKTIVRNFSAIIKTIKRGEKHLFKFLTKETATAATVDESGRLILNGKFSSEQVNELLRNYIEQFVLCPECKRPDTTVIERRGVKMLHCEACGAVSSVKGL